MAQQTQVARVLERYERWLRALADGRRARRRVARGRADAVGRPRLQPPRAAPARGGAIVARDGWPRDGAGLRALPGVGPYTAAAVASFAFGERGRGGRHERAPGRRAAAAPNRGELLPRGRHADWNQAAMELGARFCTARAPALRRRARRRRGARRAGGSTTAPRAPRAPRASASRTPTAGRAAASSPRWPRARGCRAPIDPARWSACWPRWSATGSSSAAGSEVGLPRLPR